MGNKNKKASKKVNQQELRKGLMGNATDYRFYTMTGLEKAIGYAIGFSLAAAVAIIFYRSIIFAVVLGGGIGFVGIKLYRQFLIRKRREALLLQFKDLLEALAASYSAGKNTIAAFMDCQQDMIHTYGKQSDIVQELSIINAGLENNYIIEDLLHDFAMRAELEDIQSFADVFEVCNRQGGDIRQIVCDTRTVINDKIEMEQEMKTMLNAGKQELNIMILMPILIVMVTGMDSGMSIATNTPINIIVKTIAIAIFAVAYIWGRKITDVQI